VQTLLAPFSTVASAIGAVPRLLGTGIVPCAVEFIEHSVILLAERLVNKTWPSHDGNASLMLILDGRDEQDTLGQAEVIGAALEQAGALDVLLTGQKGRQAEMLEIRSMLYDAIKPGVAEAFDVCVPRSEIAPHVGFVRRLEEERGFVIPTFGHAADGNVHSHALKRTLEGGVFGGELPGWRQSCDEIRRALYEDVTRRGGVISGEHGIGLLKKEHLSMSLGGNAVAVMRSIKKALDPDGILNPGKIFDA
jgi:glycolate oxidase